MATYVDLRVLPVERRESRIVRVVKGIDHRDLRAEPADGEDGGRVDVYHIDPALDRPLHRPADVIEVDERCGRPLGPRIPGVELGRGPRVAGGEQAHGVAPGNQPVDEIGNDELSPAVVSRWRREKGGGNDGNAHERLARSEDADGYPVGPLLTVGCITTEHRQPSGCRARTWPALHRRQRALTRTDHQSARWPKEKVMGPQSERPLF